MKSETILRRGAANRSHHCHRSSWLAWSILVVLTAFLLSTAMGVNLVNRWDFTFDASDSVGG